MAKLRLLEKIFYDIKLSHIVSKYLQYLKTMLINFASKKVFKKIWKTGLHLLTKKIIPCV